MSTYIIVGGVAGGATAAARLRRLDEKAQIIVLERGKYVSFANIVRWAAGPTLWSACCASAVTEWPTSAAAG